MEWLNRNVEEFLYRTYTIRSDYNEFNLRIHDDNGSSGLTSVCLMAENDKNINNSILQKNKIMLSGQGADELFSDYGHNGQSKYLHSNFGGLYPQDLKSIFPWPSFFGSSMTSYLCKEEYIAGNHGFEARYPFLDKQVVQEFLNLTCELKNSRYKSVLDNYLTINNFPFARDQKIGF
jgi:asparagine synthetase B (glutamine-hydrolysing)